MESYLVDAYKVLGLTKDVESSAIRSAYKKLALKCHPDKVQGSEEFKAEKRAEWDQIQKAYEQLGDDVKRAKYDKERPTKEYLHFLRREKETRDAGKKPDPFLYEVRTAEPKSSSTSYAQPKVYTQSPESSYENLKYATPRHSSSYESDRPLPRRSTYAVRDDERIKDSSHRSSRRHEDEDKLRRQAEKLAEKSSHSDKKKSRDKERRRGTEEKTRSRVSTFVESNSEDERYERSRHRDDSARVREAALAAAREEGIREERARQEKRERARERPTIRTADLAPKWAEHDNYASQYIKASQRKAEPSRTAHAPMPGMRRAETFAAPTSQQRYKVSYASPTGGYSDDEDAPRRSSGRRETRRASEAPISRQESLSRENSSKSSRRSPYIVDAPEPPVPRKPTLQTHSSAPPNITSYARKEPSRSKTQEYPRTEKTPPLPRAATFAGERGRGGKSGLRHEVYSADSDSDDAPYSPRRPSPPHREPTRYNIIGGKTVPIPSHRSDLHESYSRDRSESPRGSSRPDRPSPVRHSTEYTRAMPIRSSSYHPVPPPIPPSGHPIIVDAAPPTRPKLPRENSRSNVHGPSPRGSPGSGGAYFNDVKYAPQYGHDNVNYSSYPPSDPYTRRGSEGYGGGHHSNSSSRDYSTSYNTSRGGRQQVYA